jgi:hypothetical protein
LPIVISVPHGGSLSPNSIPNRTCNDPTTVTDANTIELGQQIDSSFFKLTGCHPHMIYCNLKRSKLDCNRNLEDGACANAEAETAWKEFHAFIDTAQNIIKKQYNNNGFYIDLHGHGHSKQRLELGYLLYSEELAYKDSVLNTSKYINFSSIRNLVLNNANTLTHAQLLRGQYALGTMLNNVGYPSVPSLQDPMPDKNDDYFSGGYNTANHTSYIKTNPINGVQIECNYNNVRDNYKNRKKFADNLAQTMLTYLDFHQKIQANSCKTPTSEPISDAFIFIYPNILTTQQSIQIYGADLSGKPFEVYNLFGQIIEKGKIELNNQIIFSNHFENGIHFLSIRTTPKPLSFQLFVIQ